MARQMQIIQPQKQLEIDSVSQLSSLIIPWSSDVAVSPYQTDYIYYNWARALFTGIDLAGTFQQINSRTPYKSGF